MPNIFGKSVHDYRHLTDLKANNKPMYDGHMHNMQRQSKGQNVFNTLTPKLQDAALNDVELNSQAFGYVTNSLQAIQAEIEEVLYLDFRLDEFFPIISNVPEGAVTYAYRVVDRAGEANFISNMGTDANSAQATVRLTPYGLEYGGILPEWNYEDLRRAQFQGVALDAETIRSGTEGCMDHIERVGLVGQSEVGFEGLTNHSQITTQNASGTFASMTADELVEFLQGEITAAITRTNEIFGRVLREGLCIYLPINQYALVTERGYGDNRDKSIWDYVVTNNTWYNYTGNMPMIKAVAELDQAGAGSTDRMLLGFNNDRVMEMAMPFAPRVINTIQKPFGVCTPMEYKISGLNVKRPTAMRYTDGI